MCTQLVKLHPVHSDKSWRTLSLAHGSRTCVVSSVSLHMRAFSLNPGGMEKSLFRVRRVCVRVFRDEVGLYAHAATWRDVYDSGRVPFTRAHTARGRAADVSRCVWESPRVVYGQAGARARRLFCNEIYNYNCKLTLSSGPESRSYGISINYRFNLIPMSTVRTIDHMIDSRSRQGYESNNNAGRETP